MPPRKVQNYAFPVGGLSENFAYETQPPGTTVSAQNVRAYDESSGRLRGGQRPGIAKFAPDQFTLSNSGGTNPKAFQSLLQLTGTDVSKMAGDKSLALPLSDSSVSKILTYEDFPGVTGAATTRQTATLENQGGADLNGVVELSVYDKNGNLYVVSVNTVDEDSGGGFKHYVLLHKLVHRPTDTTPDITAVKLGYIDEDPSGKRVILGMGHYNGYLYIYARGANSINGEAGSLLPTGTAGILKVKDNLEADTAASDYEAPVTNAGFVSGNGANSDEDVATRNLLAVGHDRLYIAIQGATHHHVSVRGWRLGIQDVSDTPAGDIVVAINSDTSGGSEAHRIDMALSNKGGLYILYSMLTFPASNPTYHVAKIHRDFSGLNTDFASSGIKLGANTLSSISYCSRTDRLAVAGTTDGSNGVFAGTNCHVAMLDNNTGAVAAPKEAGPRLKSAIDSWESVHAKGDGELVLARMKDADTVEVIATTKVYEEFLDDDGWSGNVTGGGTGNNKSFDVPGSTAQAAAANRAGAALLSSIYNVYDLDFGEKSTMRQSFLVGVGEGTIRYMEMVPDPTKRAWENINGGSNVLDHSVPVVFGIPFYGRQNSTGEALTTHGVRDPIERPIYGAFFVDGSNKQIYDFYDNKVKAWTTSSNIEKGNSFPEDSGGMFPNLIESWRGRIVMSGCPNEPHNWFMTAIGTMDDWQYFPEIVTEYTATAGHVSDAGQMPDIIRGLVPFSDDVMIFLGDRSIWQLSGDPMSGGRWDLLSDKTGSAWGRAWCKDSHGVVYFFGSTGGVYRIQPRGLPQKITVGVIDKKMRDIDLSSTIVRMEWNEKAQGVHLFFIKNDKTSKEECYFYDARSNSWWPDKFDHLAHNTSCTMTYDGDASGDREVLLGGRDGYVYKFDSGEPRDRTENDATYVDIDSHVYLGPIAIGYKIVVDEVHGKLALNSGTVKWDMHAGSSAESALPGDVVGDDITDTTRGLAGTGSWVVSDIDGDNIGKNVERMRAVGDAFYLKLYNDASPSKRWAFESVQVQYYPVGREASRTL